MLPTWSAISCSDTLRKATVVAVVAAGTIAQASAPTVLPVCPGPVHRRHSLEAVSPRALTAIVPVEFVNSNIRIAYQTHRPDPTAPHLRPTLLFIRLGSSSNNSQPDQRTGGCCQSRKLSNQSPCSASFALTSSVQHCCRQALSCCR